MSNEDYESELQVYRHVGDSKTWKLPLDVTGIDISSVPDFVIENAFFMLNERIATDDIGAYYHIKAEALEISIFQYTYTEAGRKILLL